MSTLEPHAPAPALPGSGGSAWGCRTVDGAASPLPATPGAASAGNLPQVPQVPQASPQTRLAPIRVLHLEDSEPDHALAMAHLQRAGLRVQTQRVESRAEFAAALAPGQAQRWDLVLSDYHLPGFSGLDALQMLRSSGLLLPFILVSGQIGEDTAVEAMRNGASDYLLKANLSRLVPAVENAIQATEMHRARLAAEHEVQVSRQRLSELAQHLQTSVEAERHAIAREIHDDVGGSLTALKFDLDWIRKRVPDAAVQQRVMSALETVTQAIAASQHIMQNLRPAILEQGLVAALQWMTNAFEKRTGIACEFRSNMPQTSATCPEGLPLPAGVPLVVYRTAQEALTNVSKHASAGRVSVDLSLTGGVLSLEVSDNGQGLGQADLAKARSFGIRGLHERASTVGGWVELSSRSGRDGRRGGGTTLILSVPLNATAAVDQPGQPAGADADALDSDGWPRHEASVWGAR